MAQVMSRKLFPSIALVLMSGWLGSVLSPWGQGARGPAVQAASGAAGNPIALVEQTSGGAQVLYLLDQAQRTVAVYQYDPARGKLKLSASRHFGADMQLLEFNNEEPHVADIERLSRSK